MGKRDRKTAERLFRKRERERLDSKRAQEILFASVGKRVEAFANVFYGTRMDAAVK